MQNRLKKRLLASVLCVSLIFSTGFVSSAEGSVVEFDQNTINNNLNGSGIRTPDVSASDVSSSDASASDVSSSDASASDVSSSDASASDVSSSDASASDVSSSDASASDVSSSDVSASDVGSLDVSASDVSSSDVSASDIALMSAAESVFWVTDGSGQDVGGYADWNELLDAFKNFGDKEKEYQITVAEGGVIGKTMPSKAAKITLIPSREDAVLQFAGKTVNLATKLEIVSARVEVLDSGSPVGFSTKGKTLSLQNVTNLGAVKGTSGGALYLDGEVEIQGVLQTFKSVTVNGSVKLEGNVSAITYLDIENGVVYLTSGRSFTVTNVAAGGNGSLMYPVSGKMPAVKINGRVTTGVLNLCQYEESDQGYVERYFTAGSRLLTAAKESAQQFVVHGEGQSCYRRGNVIYVGAEVLQLFKGDEFLGVYVQWEDLIAHINALKNKDGAYRIVLLDDFVINGAMTMPAKGKYAGLTVENGTGQESVSLQATGNLTMTADLEMGESMHMQVAILSGASWRLGMQENAVLVTTGNLTVRDLSMGRDTLLQCGGKFTVKNLLEAYDGGELVLTHKKGAAIKNTNILDEGTLSVKMRDTSDNRVTLSPGTNLFTVSGASYATQFRLLDARDGELKLYRKGNAIKVQGNVETPVVLYHVTGDKEVCLGEYASLADVKTEIGRRKEPRGVYRLNVEKEIFVKGALPLPGAGTYSQLIFSGEAIRLTGNITLTGNVDFKNTVSRVKSQSDDTQTALTVNVSKYKLTLSPEAMLKGLYSVTGGSGSGLVLPADASRDMEMAGELKVENMWLEDSLKVGGKITVTNIYPGGDSRLIYDLAKSFQIKGNILGTGEKLILNPQKSGRDVTEYSEGMKVIGSAAKLDVSLLELAHPTAEYMFYRDGGSVKLGTAMITVFEGTLDYESCQSADEEGCLRFVRINDAIDHVNSSEQTDFVLRLDRDVPSAGAFLSPAQGKHVALCGLDGGRKNLKLSGSVTLNGGSMEVHNVRLDNGNASGTGVVLKNGASLWLSDTEVYTVSAPAGTFVTLSGNVVMRGALSGASELTVYKNAVIRGSSTVTAKNLILHKDTGEKGHAEFRLMSGKRITVNGEVESGDRGYFTVNWVNKSDVLTSISEGTVMVTAQYGEASQFRTENIKPNTLSEWALTKDGRSIKTVTPTEGEGEWSEYYL